ncbi:hypothetical protein MHB71_15835 [Paenibacillus sp. FSL H7-0940]|uniref:hypothetical protein n=1 Tax=Paenibacillus sp. FSL H7-0940 TaxID=2921443 RepID=UPI0030EC63B8
MAIYIKLEVTGSLGGSLTYETFDLIQFFDNNNNLISMNNSNLVSHNYINRATATDTAKWFVPSDGYVPYDTPSNKGVIILKFPDEVNGIKKIVAKSYSNNGGATNIEVFHSSDNGTNYTSVGKIIFTSISQTKEIGTRIGIYVNKFLISSEDKHYSITNKYKDNAIPAMTSNTTPSGVVDASSTYTTFYPWRAFDRIVDPNGWVAASGILLGWLSYEFPQAKLITAYSIKSGTTPVNRPPKTWTFEGWEGTKWVILDTRINEPNFTGEEFRLYGFKNKVGFKKYRINVTANQGAGDFLAIGDFGMYESERYITSVESSEVSILEHGMNKGMIIDLEDEFSERRSLVKESEKIGSGKVFKKSIDTNKVPIKKASII